MSYSFIKNDSTSFSSVSRVYEVYDFDTPQHLKTCLVVGADVTIKKYFITLLGDDLLIRYYNLTYESLSSTEYAKILYEFFDMLQFMSLEDIVSDVGLAKNMSSLTKENFLAFVSDVEPYYREDISDYDGIWSNSDSHSNFLIDHGVFEPRWIENYDTDEYAPYEFEELLNWYIDGVSVGLYCKFNFELLEQECEIAKLFKE